VHRDAIERLLPRIHVEQLAGPAGSEISPGRAIQRGRS
jgi:hypothetical protein